MIAVQLRLCLHPYGFWFYATANAVGQADGMLATSHAYPRACTMHACLQACTVAMRISSVGIGLHRQAEPVTNRRPQSVCLQGPRECSMTGHTLVHGLFACCFYLCVFWVRMQPQRHRVCGSMAGLGTLLFWACQAWHALCRAFLLHD